MKVFLGSSYTDLQPHRKAVIEALERLSISVAAMELWHAKPGDPLSVCLEHVRVADVYICIIAHRYGTLTEDGRSFTHQEYDCAFAAGIECLVFIIDDDYPVSPQFIDSDDLARRLAQFKSTLKHRHVCSFFTRPEDLAFKVTESLQDLMVRTGTPGAEFLDLPAFWNEMQQIWLGIDPPDLRMEFDAEANPIALLNALSEVLDGLEVFDQELSASYEHMVPDLKQVMLRLGVDPGRLDEIPYYENPFENRNWELITFFPNRISKARIAVVHLYILCLQMMGRRREWTHEDEKALADARRRLRKALESGIYID